MDKRDGMDDKEDKKYPFPKLPLLDSPDSEGDFIRGIWDRFISDGSKRQLFITAGFDTGVVEMLSRLGFVKHRTRNRNYYFTKVVDGKLIKIFLNRKANINNSGYDCWFKSFCAIISDFNVNEISSITELKMDTETLKNFLKFLYEKTLNTFPSNSY